MSAPSGAPPASLFDRLAMAFLSGLSALLTGALIWAAVHLLLAQTGSPSALSFAPVLWFAALAALAGFLLLENYVLRLLAALWRGIWNLLPWVG